ncbi:hypothetical protein C8R47DRAFT_1127777 [Mycena vitilis]|nr:hypothetical protein C8R47DRAFT_1127777 [Mycena vitilis]
MTCHRRAEVRCRVRKEGCGGMSSAGEPRRVLTSSGHAVGPVLDVPRALRPEKTVRSEDGARSVVLASSPLCDGYERLRAGRCGGMYICAAASAAIVGRDSTGRARYLGRKNVPVRGWCYIARWRGVRVAPGRRAQSEPYRRCGGHVRRRRRRDDRGSAANAECTVSGRDGARCLAGMGAQA